MNKALWAYRITWKNPNGFSPYQLVLLIEFQIHTYRLATELEQDLSEAQQQRIMQLSELDEIRKEVVEHTSLVQPQRTKWHDRFIKKKKIHIGD